MNFFRRVFASKSDATTTATASSSSSSVPLPGQVPPLRIWALSIQGSRQGVHVPGDPNRWGPVLWAALDVLLDHQRFMASKKMMDAAAQEKDGEANKKDSDDFENAPPAEGSPDSVDGDDAVRSENTASAPTLVSAPPLLVLDVDFNIHHLFNRDQATVPILGPLTTSQTVDEQSHITDADEIGAMAQLKRKTRAQLTIILLSQLEVLRIKCNNFDEAANIEKLTTLATQLREFSMPYCGLTSLRGLQGRCEYLQKVDVSNCRLLSSLDGLQEHELLEEVDASWTSIASVRELQFCPRLTKITCNYCMHLANLDGLQKHSQLREVTVTVALITSVMELQDCPLLTKVTLNDCKFLTSLDGLQGHVHLTNVAANETAIPSVRVLLDCPALTTVDVSGCQALESLDGLQQHAHLEVAYVFRTDIVSVQELHDGCPALRVVNTTNCRRLIPRLSPQDFPDGVKVFP